MPIYEAPPSINSPDIIPQVMAPQVETGILSGISSQPNSYQPEFQISSIESNREF